MAGHASPPDWTIDGIAFDTRGWRVEAAAPASMTWSDEARARIELNARAPHVEAEPSDVLLVLRDHHRRQAAARGAGLVSVDWYSAVGIRAVEVVTKRPVGSGYAYDGLLGISGPTGAWVLEVHADEGNMTGTREALVTAALAELGKLHLDPPRAAGGHGRIAGWTFDPYDPALDDGALNAIPDDDRLDEILPWHPLSTVRRILRRTRSSLVLASAAGRTEPVVTLGPKATSAPPGVRRGLQPEIAEALLAILRDGRARHVETRRRAAREHQQTGIGILVVAVFMSALALYLSGEWNVFIAVAFVWGGIRVVQGLRLRQPDAGDAAVDEE
jgi:hypothetical protein